ncbi:enoyl-CoA hydratase [Mycobacterium sp. CBMA293]|uniref:enoyl-CoA hydratase-related protein n=1 Tax=unclassified Mycolicibacterium TaxID=2636767 RepID=UPI001322DE44|nr:MULTISPECIES: enoyl-CoA hydratase-related protein [unclassified Mycolicibacterium]MUL49478.1 enoyl-CoA hydratase [Mycolicibacterium sp. CBMA 360]MUL92347.1 enoyl-CoA hydratase [Mycolicibacterium sp. CBMA 230]MUM33803.1 enoyl-CoA hydratase [Mycolicibacterium sp. CBMA 361]MUL57259.1 enoyl-CoA hydratase [Mycolicibacterium sp. CBMA 335]MUL70299.1 enoyl-CoA hydratase [Mycolicibacterium sp. CBMA 311]
MPEPIDGIRVERSDHIATVWLDRPDRGNAFTSAMQDQLHVQLQSLDCDEGVRAIVVTGSGRLFSAGADMEPGGSTFAFDEEQHRRARTTMGSRPRPWQLRTPIIGALNGSAVGIGLTFPLQWDIRIVNQDAKYGFVFTRRGLTPEQNSLWLLPKLVGLATATELLLTGRLFSGTEAQRMGIANEALPADEVLARAVHIAREIAENTAPAAVGVTKQLLYETLHDDDREHAFYREWETFRWMGRQPDCAEGTRAFLDKRPPQFTGPKHAELPTFDTGWDVP